MICLEALVDMVHTLMVASGDAVIATSYSIHMQLQTTAFNRSMKVKLKTIQVPHSIENKHWKHMIHISLREVIVDKLRCQKLPSE